MARADAAPYPADLIHLRPTDAAGLRVIGVAAAGTALGFLLSFAGGFGLWICGQVLLALMLVQWFVILHECGHDTLFRTRRWHALAGGVAAIFSLIPYHCWIRVHGHHNWTAGRPGSDDGSLVLARAGARSAHLNACWLCGSRSFRSSTA